MADATDADLPGLEAMAGRLRRSGDALDALGRDVPGRPDAGAASGPMGAVIAHLAGCAGDMVIGMRAAGDQITQARRTYAGQDAAAAQSFQGH
jgi:hypothetical protein